MKKLISVVVPTFNRKELTDRAVESVATLHPLLFEIIVVDDCGTVPYVYDQALNPSGVPVSTLRTANNGGPSVARKLGVEHSQGSIIAFLDSDDVFAPGWADSILAEVLQCQEAYRNGLFIAGNVSGGSIVQRQCVQLLASIPTPLLPLCVRIAVTVFNPFYTPATAMSKRICTFLSSGSYCEDYFTNAMAIFKAQKIVVLAKTACTISRFPGSLGGLSEFKQKMKEGESYVRRMLMHSPMVPLCYRAMVPIGMVYAALRPRVKSLLSRFKQGTDIHLGKVKLRTKIDAEPKYNPKRLAILGTRGIPARYGGFETFAERLAIGLLERGVDVTVYCERGRDAGPDAYRGVRLRYAAASLPGPLRTIDYDVRCLWSARKDFDVVYMLGYGAAPFCLIPRLWATEVWINPDGLEWARAKWGFWAKLYFRLMEWFSVRVPNRVVADSQAIADSLAQRHGKLRACSVIAYGCDTIEAAPPVELLSEWGLSPNGYYLVVCRLEPENHVLEILRAFQQSSSRRKLVVVGDHLARTRYVEQLHAVQDSRIQMIGAVYDQARLTGLRYHSFAYLHGHSVGGTNPSLLEAMGCGNFVLAHDNPFNRETLGDAALYFKGVSDLNRIFEEIEEANFDSSRMSSGARRRAKELYGWPSIVEKYAQLLQG